MPLHVHDTDAATDKLQVRPQFTQLGEVNQVPKLRLAPAGMDADTAYQVVHDELLLDGNARLNLATFVTTWMEPQARRLIAETLDKNMIDKDEYPQTAELERPLREHPGRAVARRAGGARLSGRRRRFE